MLFGNRFSRHAPYSTPFIPEDEDVGGGMAQPKPKVGIFAKGGIGRGIVGSIGDALMAQAGMQPLYAQAMEYQRGEPDRELERELKRAQIGAARNKTPQMSNAARMAQEMGLRPGSAEYANFIRRYAFKPMVLQVPNAMGGTDFQEYDPSGASQGGLQPGHVEDGYRYNGGDPSNPSSWSEM